MTDKPQALSPADFAQQLAQKFQQQQQTLPPASGTKIKASRTKMFEFPDGRQFESFNGIIVDFRHEKRWYKDRFKEGTVTAPGCFAISVPGQEMAPHETVTAPIAATCAECPKAQWDGSGKGATPPACADGVRLAILTSDMLGKPKLYKMNLSRTAVGPFTKLVGALGCHTSTKTWAFSFDPTRDYPSIRVQPTGDVTPEQLEAVQMFMADAEAFLTQTYDYD